MNRTRFLTLLGLVVLVSSLVSVGRLATAHPDHSHGGSSTPGASPMAGLDTGTGAAYLTITNTGDEDDTLLGATSEVAKAVEIHDMTVKNDVMSMVYLQDGLVIPAGESVVLEPMSLHIMLIGLNHSLMPGDRFELTLRFEHAGEVTVTVPIASEAPVEGETHEVGDLVVEGVWSRPAPMLTSQDGQGTPDATPQH
jgi:copper(I)-binding protein